MPILGRGPTTQYMNFRTEEDMNTAIAWLATNLDAEDYEVLDSGQAAEIDVPEGMIGYFLSLWFSSMELAVDYYNALADIVWDPWYVPPEEPPEEG